MTAGPIVDAVSPYSSPAGSTRVRLTDWFDHLGLGVRHHAFAGLPDARPATLMRHLPRVARAQVDLMRWDPAGATVVMSREASPFSRGGIESRILSRAAHGAYDIDDALFHDTSLARRAFDPARKCARAMAAADVVIAGNDYLADFARRHQREVVVIPSCVEPGTYRVPDSWDLHDVPRLVWLGSPATETFVVGIAPALARVHERTGARLRLISGPRDNPALAPIAHLVDRVPWSVESFAASLAEGDVALGPLDDTPYARGKCAYKLLQYAASGLPMIGSPVGANALALQRFDGVAARSLDEWTDGLLALLDETAARREQRGRTGLAAVREHYSFDAWAPTWTAAVGVESA